MIKYKNKQTDHHKPVLKHFLKVSEARLCVAFGNGALSQATQTTFVKMVGK